MIHILLSTARSGSTWYGSKLAKSYHAKFLNEIFHDKLKEYHKKDLIQILQNFADNDSCLIKIFPNHFFKSSVKNLDKLLFDATTSVEILIRRNFTDQVKSIYVAQEYESYINPDKLTTISPTWQDDFSEPFTVDHIDDRKLGIMCHRLKKELTFLSEVYKTYNFKLTYFEDVKDDVVREHSFKVGKLHRPVIWNEPFPVINFNTESLFR